MKMDRVRSGVTMPQARRKASTRHADLWLGGSYFLAAAIALLFTRFGNGIALSWFGTALPVPRLAMTRPRHWGPPILSCALASMVTSATLGAGLAAAPLFAAALMLEASIGAWLLQMAVSPETGHSALVVQPGRFAHHRVRLRCS